MATKKYFVRDGFVLVQTVTKPDGSTYQRRTEGKEEVSLDDGEAAVHAHKLELVNARDREAALAAEKDASVQKAAAQAPADFVGMLSAAISQAIVNSNLAVKSAALAAASTPVVVS